MHRCGLLAAGAIKERVANWEYWESNSMLGITWVVHCIIESNLECLKISRYAPQCSILDLRLPVMPPNEGFTWVENFGHSERNNLIRLAYLAENDEFLQLMKWNTIGCAIVMACF